MKEVLDNLLKTAVSDGWDLTKVEFVMNALVFWSDLAGVAKYKPANDLIIFGMRGVYEFEGIEIRCFINPWYKENLICLHKDRTTCLRAITANTKPQ